MKLLVATYRLRMTVYFLSVVAFVAFTWLGAVAPNQQLKQILIAAALASIGVFLLTILLIFSGKKLRPSHDKVAVVAPVAGRWLGLNSPQDKVPSHGVHTLGQTYAIDLIHDPDGSGRRPLSRGIGMHPPQEFVSFGQPVFAMVSGEVVRVSQWRRDHESRSSLFAILFLLVEAAIRELGGAGFIMGNHVVIRGANGVHAVVCHLQRGSVSVKIGQQVVAGQQIGLCGNSGNSSEPHVHAQLMDRANLNTAFGIPMAFKDTTIDDAHISGPTLPANGQAMNAPAVSLTGFQ